MYPSSYIYVFHQNITQIRKARITITCKAAIGHHRQCKTRRARLSWHHYSIRQK